MTVEVVKQEEKLGRLALSDIRVNPESLRGVNKTDIQYIELATSVADRGVLIPIRVRECVDTDTNQRYYSLIDGLQRFTAAGDAGFDSINAVITSSDDAEVLEEQLIANLFKVETRPVEYTHQLRRMLRLDPTMTMARLASRLKKSESWLKQRLELTKLCPEAAQLVDGGQINLNNAYALSKLPPENQTELLDAAMNKTYQEFGPLADARRTELTKARRAGKTDTPVVFEPKISLRKAGDIEAELASGKVSTVLLTNVSSKEDAWAVALKWVLSLDEISVAEQKRVFEENQKALADKREAAKKEREARSEAAGALKQKKLLLQLELQNAGKTPAEIITALAEFDIANNIAPPKVTAPKTEQTKV